MSVSLDLLAHGFAQAITPENLLYALVGCLVGTLIGVLPGIGPTSGIAILLPLTTVLPPTSAIIMMAAVYYGAMYGGSTTAIVVNIPGEASSVPTAIDGYELAKQGRAGAALGMAAISSFVAGTLSLIGLTVCAPLLAGVALAFGPPEYFALMVMSIVLAVSLSDRALVKGAVAVVIGVLTATIGLDPVTGLRRLTFGSVTLMAGINFVSVVIGLFAISELLVNVEHSARHIYDTRKLGTWLPTRQDLRESLGTMVRASGIGFALGLLPGFSPAVTTFIAYDVEKRLAKDPSRFGRGAMQGVVAAEGANNATCSGGFVPLFAFGVPSSPPLAVLMGALLMFGLQPGPRLFQENPQFVWTVIASMYVGNVILLALNLPLVGVWARIALIPFPILGPIILLCSVIGAYSVRYLLFDVWMAVLFGIIGYALRKTGIPLAPIVLASVLTPTLETSLKQSLILSDGSASIFVTRPLTGSILLITAVLAVTTLRRSWKARGVSSVQDDD
jgi:putative tricarboxylic transport membrane protein